MKKYILHGELQEKFNDKSVSVTTEFVIKSIDDIDVYEYDQNKITLNNCGGYKVDGLVFCDIYKSTRNFSNLPIKEHTSYNLKLFKNNFVTSFPVLILKKENEVEIGDNTFRYFFSFCKINKCSQDDVVLFDEQIKFLKYPRIFIFNVIRNDNECLRGIINSINISVCKNIILQNLKKRNFIRDEQELSSCKIEEIVLSEDNLSII